MKTTCKQNKILLFLAISLFSFLILASVSHAWYLTKEFAKELQEKQRAVDKNPNDPLTRFDLAITMAYTNKIPDGWTNLKKAVEIDPAFRKKGLEIYYNKAVESPDDWRIRFRLAFAYYFNDKKRDAIEELKNVLILDPYNVWAYGYIALIYGELNEVDTALGYTKKGLAIDSNVAALHLLLAEGMNRKGNKWGSIQETMEAMRLRALGY
ncbi:MAG: hypothetical protein WCV91_03810 [Candidatus Margulisiibacteriota bacterium]